MLGGQGHDGAGRATRLSFGGNPTEAISLVEFPLARHLRSEPQAVETPVAVCTVAEAAARYRLSKHQIRNLVHAGVIPAGKPFGQRAYLLDREALDRYFANVVHLERRAG